MNCNTTHYRANSSSVPGDPTELREFCRAKRIQIEAYGPLTQGQRLRDHRVMAVAEKVKKTPAQVFLRWALQGEIVVIPKSVRRSRIEENAGLYDFSLSASDMAILDSLDDNFRTCWDPSDVA